MFLSLCGFILILDKQTVRYIPGAAEPLVIGVVTNTYDKLNQLVKTVSDGTTLTNTYNGEGLRVSKTSGGETTYFLHEYDKVVLEVNSDGTQKARNLFREDVTRRKRNTH